MKNLTPPTTISLRGEDFPVTFPMCYTGDNDLGYAMVDGVPIASINFYSGEPAKDHLRRAECALISLRDNEGRLSLLPELGYGYFDSVSPATEPPAGHYDAQLENAFDESMLDDKYISIDPFNICGIPHITFTTKVKGRWGCLDELTFNIWDRDLIRRIVSKANKKCRDNGQPVRFTPEIDGFHQLFEGL